MATVSINKCDGCGKLVEKASGIYGLHLESRGSVPCPAGGWGETRDIHLDFCEQCAYSIKDTLEKILRRKQRAVRKKK